MTLRRGLLVALVAATVPLGAPAALARRGDASRIDQVLASVGCGFESLSLVEVEGAPNDRLSISASDGTRRGTRLLGDVPSWLRNGDFDFRGPESGWTWLVGRNPRTGGSAAWFLNPARGMVPAFTSEPGKLRKGAFAGDSRLAHAARDGLWMVLDRGRDSSPAVVRFQPFPDSDLVSEEWEIGSGVGPIHVEGDTAVFLWDGGDGAGREIWRVRRGDERARRVSDFLPGEEAAWAGIDAVAPPLVLFSAGVNQQWLGWAIDVETGQSRRIVDLLGDEAALWESWHEPGRILCVEGRPDGDNELVVLESQDGVPTATRVEFRPGPEGSWPQLLLPDKRDGRLLFTADDGLHGREVWTFDPATKETRLFDLVRGPLAPDVGVARRLGRESVVFGSSPTGIDSAWFLRGDTAARVDGPRDGRLRINGDSLEAWRRGRRRTLYRRGPANSGTFDDSDGLGFTDDVMSAVRRLNPSWGFRTPAANAPARLAGALEVRRLSVRGASAEVEVFLPAPATVGALSAGTWIVDVGGLVAVATFAPGQTHGGRGRGRIVRSLTDDLRVLVRARVVGGRPRRDGPGGTIPVLVWRETERFEGAAAPR
jgi:ELWxxDGT repeat protein